MYSPKLVTGQALPERTLCLTYDDGPSAGTLQLAGYLRDLGCPATFFALGRQVEQFPDTSAQLLAMGHRVGNHTYSHPDLVQGLKAGTDHAGNIRRTDLLIRDGAGPVVFFRAPYGNWSPDVAAALNAHPMIADGHAGPIYWDFDSRDWEFCAQGRSPRECADFCLQEIGKRRRGILLMHDGSANRDPAAQAEFTLRVTQLLLPPLLEQGYRFVLPDTIPEVVALAAR